MEKAFDTVYNILSWISNVTGFSYQEINIILYYLIIPLIIFILLDLIFRKHYFKIGFVLAAIISIFLINDFQSFSFSIFNKSVSFLEWFNIIGLDYIASSVIICVIAPIMVIILLLLIYRHRILLKRKAN